MRTSLRGYAFSTYQKKTTVDVDLLPSGGLKSILRMVTNSDHEKFLQLESSILIIFKCEINDRDELVDVQH